MNHWKIKNLLLCGITFILMVFPHVSPAAGFLLSTESTSALGEALSGGAAIAEDASTNWYNPAGLTRINHPQIVSSGQATFIKHHFSGNATAGYDIFPPTVTTSGSVSTSIHGLVPAFYYVSPLFCNLLWVGVGMTIPAGLSEKYPNQAFTRFAIVHSKYQSANLNLNMAWKPVRKFSFGYGVNILRADYLDKNNVLSALNTTGSPGSDWTLSQNVHGYAFGANLGILVEPWECTRIGLSYRWQMNATLKGQAIINTQGTIPSSIVFPLKTNNFELNFPVFPSMGLFSIFQKLTPKWDVMGTLDFEQWSGFRKVKLTSLPVPFHPPQDTQYPEKFNDTLSYAIGTRYQLTDKIKLKTGLAYVPSAVSPIHRNLITPVAAAWVVAIGTHYQATRRIGCDLAYAHGFFKSSRVAHTLIIPTGGGFFDLNPIYTTTETGISRLSENVVGAQVTYDFV